MAEMAAAKWLSNTDLEGLMSFLVDRADLQTPCPRCGFFNRFYFRHIKARADQLLDPN
jgi:hypothetical protein